MSAPSVLDQVGQPPGAHVRGRDHVDPRLAERHAGSRSGRPSSAVDAWAWCRRGIRPARLARRPASTASRSAAPSPRGRGRARRRSRPARRRSRAPSPARRRTPCRCRRRGSAAPRRPRDRARWRAGCGCRARCRSATRAASRRRSPRPPGGAPAPGRRWCTAARRSRRRRARGPPSASSTRVGQQRAAVADHLELQPGRLERLAASCAVATASRALKQPAVFGSTRAPPRSIAS